MGKFLLFNLLRWNGYIFEKFLPLKHFGMDFRFSRNNKHQMRIDLRWTVDV